MKKYNEKIEKLVKIKGEITATWRDVKTGKIKKRSHMTNMIVTVGRKTIAMRLANVLTYTGVINYGALGTGTTPPANTDTQLETEVFRKTTASATYENNVAYISFFFGAAEVSGTFREFGNFIDGTASANTGQLFTRISVNWVKTNTETLTVDCCYSVQ